MMWHYGGLSSPDFAFPVEYRTSEIPCAPAYTFANPADIHAYGTLANESPHADSNLERAYASWERAHNAATAVQLENGYRPIAISTEHSQHPNHPLQSRIITNSAVIEENLSASAAAVPDWAHNRFVSPAWTSGHQPVENGFNSGNMLLQQATASPHTLNIHPPQVLDDMALYGFHQNATEIQYPISTSQPSASPPPPQINHRSREKSPYDVSPPPRLPEDAFTRRRSDSSELANNFDTIHLQKQNSQQNSDEDNFKVLNPSIAARRKRPRPAPLGTSGSRSHSFNNPQNVSPSLKTSTLGPSRSVRRIKSTGNSLNVMSGRVQKSSVGAAQRSPLSFQTFQEVRAMEQIQTLTGQNANNTRRSCSISNDPLTPPSPSTVGTQTLDWDKTTMHAHPDSPFIHNNQQLMSNPYDGIPGVTSPPISPFITTPAHAVHYGHHYTSPPQSAPPQLTTFRDISPQFHPTQPAVPSYIVPHTTLPEQYVYYAGAPVPQPYHPPMMIFNEVQPNMYHHSHQQYIDSSSSMGNHNVFYANPAPAPPKEMEFVLQTFPEPKGSQQAPKEPHQPREYTFQNTVPNDFSLA